MIIIIDAIVLVLFLHFANVCGGGFEQNYDIGVPRVTFKNIHGMGPTITKIWNDMVIPLEMEKVYESVGATPLKGAILYGPPGTGKTTLALAVANAIGAKVFLINGPSIVGKFRGSTEQTLTKIFHKAQGAAYYGSKVVIVIDEIDSICPQRGKGSGVAERTVTTLLELMNGVGEMKIPVIAMTNSVNDLDNGLRRAGRFDMEMLIGVPDEEGRLDIILKTLYRQWEKSVNPRSIARQTYGYSPADLNLLYRTAVMNYVVRMNLLKAEKPIKAREIRIAAADFNKAITSIKPTAMRFGLSIKPTRSFKDVKGFHSVKRFLLESFVNPTKYRAAFSKNKIRAPKGVLLFGPPGTGKSLIAEAMAHATGYNFIYVTGSNISSSYVGETERTLRDLADKAGQSAPSIIFIDEMDSLFPTRSKGTSSSSQTVQTALTLMDGIGSNPNVFWVGATNRVDAIDGAILRAGRLDIKIYIGLPNKQSRRAIIRDVLEKIGQKNIGFLEEIVKRTAHYTASDIQAIMRLAKELCIKRYIFEQENGGEERLKGMRPVIIKEHILAAIKKIPPTVSKKGRQEYIKMRNEQQSGVTDPVKKPKRTKREAA